MHSPVQSTNWAGTRLDERPEFHVAILHEDWETGLRAKHLYDRLEASQGGEAAFAVELWSLRQLEMPPERRAAAGKSAMADMIIVSLHGQGLPAAGVRAWMADLVNRRSETSGALVALLDREGNSAEDREWWLACLRHVAREAGLSFFFHDSAPVTASPEHPGFRTTPPAPVVWSPVDNEVEYSHCGINE